MALLPAEQHRGLFTIRSMMLVSCLFLWAHSVTGQGGAKITNRKPGSDVKSIQHKAQDKKRSHKNTKKAGRKGIDIDSVKAANGLPAVWYGPDNITTQEQIQELVFEEQKAAFIQFGSNKSARTRYMNPAWDKLGRYLYRAPDIVIARVDCRISPDLCKMYKITRYPTLRYFKMGAEHHTDSLRYHGNHKYDNIKAFAMRELGGEPAHCPFNIHAMEKHKEENPDWNPEAMKGELHEQCNTLERRFMEVHYNKTYPRILAIIGSIKKQERSVVDKVVFPMEMSKLRKFHKDRLKATPEKKDFLDKEFQKNKTEAEKKYIDERLKKCRFIRTINQVKYFNNLVHRSFREEGIGAGLPRPSEEWIHWAKYQEKLGGGSKIYNQHVNGTMVLTKGTETKDVVFSGDENVMPWLDGIDEFLDVPAFNGPKSDYPERFPEYATTKKTTPAPPEEYQVDE